MTGILIGKIVGLSGLKGSLRVNSYAEKPEDLGTFHQYHTQEGKVLDLLKLVSVKGSLAILNFKGIKTSEEAEKLIGLELFITRDQLPELPEGEFYYEDLIGSEVFFESGERAGEVLTLYNYGASDLMEVLLDGITEVYPFTKDVIISVEEGKIIMKKIESV
jgi:16S rRNA processing protein RimM